MLIYFFFLFNLSSQFIPTRLCFAPCDDDYAPVCGISGKTH